MSTDSVDDLRAAQAELDAVIAEIREVDGFADFLTEPNIEGVLDAGTHRPIVYLAAATAGGMALLVRDGEVTDVDLPDLTAEAVRDAADGFVRRLEQFRRAPADDADRCWHEWTAYLDRISAWLWPAAMARVVDRLGPGDPDREVALVACGGLTLLPLHAAWTTDPVRPTGRRYAIDEAVWTYTANARALGACAVAAGAGPVRTSLAVSDPQAPNTAGLPIVSAVSTVVKSLFPGGMDILSGPEATHGKIAEALPDADLVHIGCHGWADLLAPLRSQIQLADGRLTLDDILRLRLSARLVVLAACETAMVGTDLPDEVVSLPTGLVQAGAAAVVASMWSCEQLPTAIILTDFYRRWREGASPPAALAGAQRWLRDLSPADLDVQWEAALDRGEPWLPPATATTILNAALLEPGEQWSRIEAWAAFAYTGF